MQKRILILTALCVAAPVRAQTPAQASDADAKVAGAALPDGWSMRLDRANASPTNVKFVTMGDGLHATLGPAAIFYKPDMTATGAYTASATFTQTRPSQHPEAYGLFIGGKDLESTNQDYLYYVVRQDGMFLVKHRAGAETHTLQDWKAHTAINQPAEGGAATNALRIDVAADAVRFYANGELVHTIERVPYLNSDGVVGLRVNHNLDVHIADLAVKPAE